MDELLRIALGAALVPLLWVPIWKTDAYFRERGLPSDWRPEKLGKDRGRDSARRLLK